MNKKKLEKKERNKKDKEWREKILNKFNYTCAFCPETKRINCHHIIPKEFKEFRWDENNGIALCPLHHKFGKYSAHRNPLWFFDYIKILKIPIDMDYLLSKLRNSNENNKGNY